MSKKEIKHIVPLEIPAGNVSATGPIATTLGPKGVNLGLVVKTLQEMTAQYEKDAPVRVSLIIYDDRSVDFEVLGHPVKYYILKAAGAKQGAQKPGRENIGSITKAQALEIAKAHMKLLNTDDLDKAFYTVEGSAKSMGITIN